MRTPGPLLVVLATVVATASCAKREPKGGGAKLLATVNGAPITEVDLELLRSRSAQAAAGPAHELSANVLQTLVRDEVIYQKAVELGLDQDPAYRQRVDVVRAQLRALERQEMAGIFRNHVRGQAKVTEAEARDYFEKNAALIRTRYHVFQILQRGNYAEIARDHEDVKGGKSFEEVVARRFPGLPPGTRAPWDLGSLAWYQLPPAWRGVVDRLEPGQVSDVIKGPGERFWIVKLAGKTVEPGVAFEGEKERIVELLREEKANELYDRTLAELRAKAKIIYAK